MKHVRILVPSGVLGLGFDSQALARGVALKPDVICIDGGSTDSGPFSLGTATSKYSRAVCKSEWRELMLARNALQVPLIIGSAGTCGCDDTVDWMLQITQEISDELKLPVSVATLYTEQNHEQIATALADDQLRALDPPIDLDTGIINSCSHIVALAGAEHIQAALKTGADIIIAGRTTDTAVVSALPLMQGCHAGACWHAAKIAECGALCSTHPTSGVIVVDIDATAASADEDQDNTSTGFTIYPLADGACCTPHSVSAHMLYENTDPYILHEPGGYLDVTEASYEALDERCVRVTGSRWVPCIPYTLKLEGARLAGYQTTLLALLRDAHYVNNARQWVERLASFLQREVCQQMVLNDDQFDIEFRLIGENAALGALETLSATAHELGVLVIVTAQSQAMSDEISKLINPFLLHYPLTDDEPLPTFAFPYSPVQSSRGPLYEFCINHTLSLEDPMSAVRLSRKELSSAGSSEKPAEVPSKHRTPGDNKRQAVLRSSPVDSANPSP